MPGRAIFLDRDGVLNQTVLRTVKGKKGFGPPWSLDQLVIAPDAPASLERLARAGYRLIVVTNQPDIARMDLDRGTLAEINAAMHRTLPMLYRRFFVCMHDNADDCFCRKPKPGMLVSAAAQFGLDLAACYMVGDRAKDVEAGHNAGCRTVWIKAVGHDEPGPARPAHFETQSLTQATDWILSRD